MIPLTQRKAKTPLLFIILVLGCIQLSPQARAVVPAPDGGYPNFNTAEGQNALLSLTTGGFNTAVGWVSLRALSTGQFNTGVGAGTLVLNTADQNTATGTGALLSNTIGRGNTADGAFALFSNTEANGNTASGNSALFANTTGTQNTAVGAGALYSNTTGSRNTASGITALQANISGNDNTAVGMKALFANTNGGGNTAVGAGALSNSTTGPNDAFGINALVNITKGSGNTAIGNSALFDITTGSNNIALGAGAGGNLTTGSNNIYIGHQGSATQNNSINIGVFGTHTATFIAGVHGTGTNGGIPVYIDGSGQLGTTTSSRRFKKDIEPMDAASEAILALKPVAFRYKNDKTNTMQFGLVAEDVAEVNPDLVARETNGQIYTVRYEAVNAMLLNEFLKEHKKVEEQQATIAELKSTFARQQKSFESKLAKQEEQIEVLTAGLQKVSAQLEVSKAAPQTVLNNQ